LTGFALLAELRQSNNPVFPAPRGGYFRAPEQEVGQLPPPAPEPSLEEEFGRLAARWRDETEHLSSTDVFTHSDYQRIIGLGARVVPLLLRDLATTGAHWFWALRAITGENPVRAEDAGSVRKMTAAWLEWGEERRLV
jgi:hypothetical protein